MTSEITPTNNESSIYLKDDAFEMAQRQARSLAASTLVPTEYRGDKGLGNCIVALDIAKRMNISPLTVMQNLIIVHNRPSWSSAWIIAQIQGCGRYENFDYVLSGEGDNMKCYCSAKRTSDGKLIKGSTVSIAMAKAEGWTRNSKWKTMPEQMLKYRSATFFGRQYIPDLLLGVQTSEEVVDITPLDVTPTEATPVAKTPKNITEGNDGFNF
tara:strand:+ start:785 stop:1420 length:636 start_codon:yes stop_codon:yes gene_type:complete